VPAGEIARRIMVRYATISNRFNRWSRQGVGRSRGGRTTKSTG
jgi:hypothetical protein